MARRIDLRAAMAMDMAGLVLLAGGAFYLALAGGWRGEVLTGWGLPLVTFASLVGCVATADKAALRGKTVVLDLLGAGTWALAVLLTPIAMIQRIDVTGMKSASFLHVLLLVWLIVHAVPGMVLSVLALVQRRQRARNGDLGLLKTWQRWLAVTGLVALAFPYVLDWLTPWA